MGDINDRVHADGTESDWIQPLDWHTLEELVPCSAIKSIHYWAAGKDKDEAGLRLVGHRYGGRYFPRPISGFWLALNFGLSR